MYEVINCVNKSLYDLINCFRLFNIEERKESTLARDVNVYNLLHDELNIFTKTSINNW